MMKGKKVWSDAWPDIEAERKTVRTQLKDWDKNGYPFPVVPLIVGLRSFANGGVMNCHGSSGRRRVK